MKLAQVLLLNVVTVVVALVVYEQVRGDAAGTQGRASKAGSSAADAAALEQRVRALEARRGLASPEEPDATVLERLAALESLAAPGTESAAKPMAKRTDDPAAAMASPGDPGPAEIKRFRQVREAVRREDAAKKNAARVDAALNKLSIRLTQRQRERIHVAHAAFQPRVQQIWTEVKQRAQETIANGGEVDRGEIVTSTNAVIQQEFAATLNDIVNHPGDAAAVAEALMPVRGGK